MTPEYLNAVASLIAAGAWPALVILILLIHRRSIAKFFENLESVRLWEFEATRKLQEVVDREATTVVATDPNAGKAPTAQQFEEAKKIEAHRFDLSVVRQQVLDLARDYEHTRAFLPFGSERTHKMEVIITKMRMLALAALPLLPELVSSPSLGARLAAIAILQVQPSPDYLQWLAARLAEDPGSFHGYHAAVALHSAAHMLDVTHREEVQRAIETARKMAREDSKGADAFKKLDEAERALQAPSR
jgi:hypothetical protein